MAFLQKLDGKTQCYIGRNAPEDMRRKWFKFRDSLTMGYICQKLAVESTWFLTISASIWYEPKTI